MLGLPRTPLPAKTRMTFRRWRSENRPPLSSFGSRSTSSPGLNAAWLLRLREQAMNRIRISTGSLVSLAIWLATEGLSRRCILWEWLE